MVLELGAARQAKPPVASLLPLPAKNAEQVLRRLELSNAFVSCGHFARFKRCDWILGVCSVAQLGKGRTGDLAHQYGPQSDTGFYRAPHLCEAANDLSETQFF